MMFGLYSFNLINEFERASNEQNAKQLASSSARLQPYLWVFDEYLHGLWLDVKLRSDY